MKERKERERERERDIHFDLNTIRVLGNNVNIRQY